MTSKSIFGTRTPIVGMVHLDPLPGAPKCEADVQSVIDRAVADATALESGGVDGVMVENFGDVPFYPDDVPKHVVAALTRVATEVEAATELPLGVNVLRNDAAAAISVAHAVGGSFVRVNVHTGARVTDQGVVQGTAHRTLRLRNRLDADLEIFADVDVKHSRPLSVDAGSSDAIGELTERGLADALVVSGSGTGSPVDFDELRTVTLARDERDVDAPIFVGSGVRETNVSEVLSIADGAIVGTALKEEGVTSNPVDSERVESFMGIVRELR